MQGGHGPVCPGDLRSGLLGRRPLRAVKHFPRGGDETVGRKGPIVFVHFRAF